MSTYTYKKAVLKGIAASLAAALCLEMPASAAGILSAPALPAISSNLPVTFPAAIAVIEDRFEAAAGRRVILIQDAHTNESAQINSARVIEKLIGERAVRTVFLEAGTGDDSLTRLREAAGGTDRARAAMRLVRKGLIQGAEYVNLVSDQDLTLWGVEDPDLYTRALDSYRAVTASRDAAAGYLDRIDVTLAYLKEKTFSPLLLELDASRRAFAAGGISAAAYLAVLEKSARVSGLDPGSVAGFDRVSRLMRRERSVRQDRVADEMRRALSGLPDAARAELEKTAGSGEGLTHPSGPAAWARAFREAAGPGYRRVLREHPNLSAYLRTAQVMAALDGLGALRSMNELEALLYARLARPRAMELARAGFAAEALRNLALMKLAPEDMRRLRASGGRVWDIAALTGFVNRRLMDLGQGAEKTVFLKPELEPVFAAALEFYRLTLLRDAAFVRNLEARMDATGEREAALVAGGYHAPHLKKLLRERGISFVSVIPQTTHPTDHDRYERLLLAQSSVSPDVSGRPAAPSVASAMSLRPAAEDGARLALVAAELGVPAHLVKVSAPISGTAAARMSNEHAARPVFVGTLPEAVFNGPAEAVFTTRFRMPDGQRPAGMFYLRRGLPGGRWDFLPATPEKAAGDGENEWTLSVKVTPYAEGTRRYEGTFVWFAPGVRPRKRTGLDPAAVWQATGPGANAGVDLTLSPEEASRHWQAAAEAVRRHLGRGTETPLQRVLPHRTIPSVRGAVQQSVDLLADRSLDLQTRLRLFQFLRDVYNLSENYLGLPAAWFMDGTGLEIIQQYPDAEELNSSEAVSNLFWKKIVDLLRDDLKQQLHTHFSSRMGVPHLRRQEEVTQATADARIDLMHGGVAKDLPVFSGSGQSVVNAAVRLKDHEGREVPGFSVNVRMPQAHTPGRPAIRFAGRYYDILREDAETPEGYAVIRKYEHVYDASFSPEAAEDLNAKYVIGALKLLMELIGQSSLEDFLRTNGRDIDIEVDSFLPERTGMGGSVTLGALVTSALLEHMLLLDKFSHEDVALLGMYLEASLGDLGGWQDGYIGPALRSLRIEKNLPVTTLKNTVPSDKKSGKTQRDLLRQLETHGVLFLTHPHRSSHTLRQLIGGHLRRDTEFMGAAAEAEADLEQFQKSFQTAMSFDSQISIEQIAGWLNRATGQFETAAPGFVTEDMRGIVDELSRRGWIRAAKPVGAGAGGFLFLLLKDPSYREQVETFLTDWAAKNEPRIREQVDENFLPPRVYQVAFSPDRVAGRTISHTDFVGARMSAEAELKGDSPAAGAAWGTAAIYEPETAEGILFQIPSENIEAYAADFRRLVDGVLQAIPTMNGASDKDTAALAGYFTAVSGEILNEFTVSKGRGERALNPIARLIRRVKDELEESGDALGESERALRHMLVDEVRAQSLHLAHLTDAEDPAARLRAAEDEAARGKRVLQGSEDRYRQILTAIQKDIARLEHLIKIKTGQLERKNRLAADLRAGRAISALGADTKRYNAAKAAAKDIQEVIDRSILHRDSLQNRWGIVDAFAVAVQDIQGKYFTKTDPDGTALRERMIRENRRFDAIMYEDSLVKRLFKQRRKFKAKLKEAAAADPQQSALFEKINELILEITQIMALIAKDRGSESSTFQLQAAGGEGQLVLFVHDTLSEDILRQIWNQHGPRIRAVVSTSATMVSHWVIVARGLPHPPAIILIKDPETIKSARRVRSGQTVAVAARSGTGSSQVYINPAPERRAQVDRSALDAERVQRHAVRGLGEVPPLPILANVTPQEYTGLAALGADGVGLVRTEVWDLEELEAMQAIASAWGSAETAEAQLQRIGLHWFFLYRRLLNESALHKNKATFRTIDIQWDKNHQFLEFLQKEIRGRPQDFPGVDAEKLTGFDFYRTPMGAEILARQIAALGLARFDLRGTNQNPLLRVMFPDVKSAADLDHLAQNVMPRAEEIFQQTLGRAAGNWSLLPKALQPYEEKRRTVAEFGTMIETAEALDDLEALSRHPLSGFWSVGTNDLTASIESISLRRKAERAGLHVADQDYRVSRDEPQYEKLFTTLTPKLLKAADRIVAAAAASGRKLEVGFCGEIAGTHKFLLYLLHLKRHGVPLYSSMAVPQIAQAKLLTRLADAKASKEIAAIFEEIKPGDDARARRLAAELITEEMKSAAASSGARMSDGDWSEIDWSTMAPEAIRSLVLANQESALRSLDWGGNGAGWDEGRSLIRQQDAAIQLNRFLNISGWPLKRLRSPHAGASEVEAELIAARRDVIARWKRFESAKAAELSAQQVPAAAGWPSGPSDIWRGAEPILRTLEVLSSQLERRRAMLEPEGALMDFESRIESRLIGALARVLFSAPFKDAKARDWVDKGMRQLEAVLTEVDSILATDRDTLFQMSEWSLDGELEIRNSLTYLRQTALGWSGKRRQELPPLPPGPLGGTSADLPTINIAIEPSPKMVVAEAALERGIDLDSLIRNARSLLDQLRAAVEAVPTDHVLESVQAAGELERNVWSLSGRREGNGLYGLDVPERDVVRRWAERLLTGQRESGADERAAQKFLVFLDRIGDAIRLAASADPGPYSEGRESLAPALSLQVWRPVAEHFLTYISNQEDPAPAMEASSLLSGEALSGVPDRILVLVKLLESRAVTPAGTDHDHALAAVMARAAGDALKEHMILLEQAEGARLADGSIERRIPDTRRFRGWASRTAAVRYWTSVADLPASEGRPFALWTGDRTRVMSVRPAASGGVRVYETTAFEGRRTRPIVTLRSGPSAARMSDRMSHFAAAPEVPDWIGPVQAFLRANHLEIAPALNDAVDPDGGLIRPVVYLAAAERLQAVAAIRVLNLRQLGLRADQLSRDSAADKIRAWLEPQGGVSDAAEMVRRFHERVPMVPADMGTFLPQSDEFRIAAKAYPYFTPRRITVAVQPSTASLLSLAVTGARHDAAALAALADRPALRSAVLDLSIFRDLDNEAFVSLVPMIAAAADRARKRAGGGAVVRITGPKVLRGIFFAAAAGAPARGMLYDESETLPDDYRTLEPGRIGVPASLNGASRPLPVRPIGPVTGGQVSFPAVELWFDAAFYLSAPDASADKLYEFFKKRTGRDDFTLEDVRGLMSGKFNLSLLHRLALPPLLRVPLADFVRAAAAAARMSERSA
jgi:phosphoenolpyruvate-protein kinase (PTS system EI component)/galactokinase/mevalonate kinase-like predicted kinase